MCVINVDHRGMVLRTSAVSIHQDSLDLDAGQFSPRSPATALFKLKGKGVLSIHLDIFLLIFLSKWPVYWGKWDIKVTYN